MGQQITSQSGLPDEKVVGNYIAVHRILEPMFHEMNQAEIRGELLRQYLMGIYDELSTISRKYLDKETRTHLLEEWETIEEECGLLHEQAMLLPPAEWHRRKRALIAMRETLGMGTTAPSQTKSLHPPLRTAEFHRKCKRACAVKKGLMESRRKWQ